MPAAVAVPAIISVAGMAASAIGQRRQQNAQKKADAAKQAKVQGVMDANYNDEMAWRNSSPFQQMLNASMGPQTTTSNSSSWENSESDQVHSMDFGPEGNEAASGVLLAAKNAPWEVNNLLAEQQAFMDRTLSGQQRTQDAAIGNAAAARGVDARLMKAVGGDPKINAARLDQGLQLKQQAYNNKQQAQGNIANVLKGLFQVDKTNTKSKSRGGSSGTQTGPANYAAWAGLAAPPKREVAV